MSGKQYMKNAKRPEHQCRSRILSVSGLALLAAVAMVLTFLAVTNSGGAESNTQLIAPSPPKVEEVPEPAEEPEPEPEPVASAVAVQRLLAVGETPGHILRASVGECAEPIGVIEVSFNGGADWAQATTADVSSTKILQLDASQANVARFVSLDGNCQPQLSRSFVGGVDWEPDDALAFAWYLDSADSAIVHTPNGAQALPCSGVGLSSVEEKAIALCSDASVTVSSDSGATWSAPFAAPNAAAVGATDAGFVVASVDGPDCSGVRVRSVTGDAVGEPGECLVAESAGSGNTAISGRNGELFLWSANQFVRSVDGGVTWQ